MRRRHGSDADCQTGSQQVIERTNGGVAPGGVRVEAEHHLLHIALEDARVLGGQRGPLRRDDIVNARQVAGDQIKLALADDGVTGVEQRALRFVEAEENFALRENRRLRRVDVLRGFVVAAEDAATEPDDAALFVANRENQPPAKPVVVMVAAFFAQDETGLLNKGQLVGLAPGPVERVVPGVGRVTEAEQFDRFIGNAALFQVIARDLSGGLLGERGLPAVGDLLVDLEQGFLQESMLLRAWVFGKLERNAGALGQPMHRFGKTDVFVFLDERENVTALVTAEAMKNLPMRM